MRKYWLVVVLAVVLLLLSLTLESGQIESQLAVIVMQMAAFWSITWAFSKLFRR